MIFKVPSKLNHSDSMKKCYNAEKYQELARKLLLENKNQWGLLVLKEAGFGLYW